MASSLNKGLIGHWTFNDADTSGSMLYDKSAYDNHGTLQNSPDTGKNGIVGEAYEFTGSEYIELPDISLPTFTLSCWFKTEPNTTERYAFIAIGNNDSNSFVNAYLHVDNPDKVRGLIDDQSGNRNNIFYQADSDFDNTWTHGAFSYNGSDASLFLNGRKVKTVTFGVDPVTSDTRKDAIGALLDGNNKVNYLKGLISEAYVHDRALTESEINRLYQQRTPNELSAQSGSGSAGIVAHWPLDDSGSTAEDKVGTSDGTLQNGVTTGVRSPTGRGMEFDGTSDSFVDIPSLDFNTNKATISFWTKGGPSQPAEDDLLVLDNPTGDGLVRIHLPWSDEMVYFDFGDSAVRISKDLTGFSWQTWNHWVFWVDESIPESRIYRNGKLISSENSAGSITEEVADGRIGGDPDASRFYDGIVSDVRVYDRALSDSEIRSIYDQGLPVPESGLEGWWTMDSDSYNSSTSEVADRSGNGNIGTVQGGVTVGSSGQIAEAFDFDGADGRVELPDLGLTNTSPFTASFWVNMDQVGSEPRQFFGRYDGNDDILAINVRNTEDFSFRIGHVGGNDLNIVTPVLAEAGRWFHLTGTWDTSELRLYVDGVLEASGSGSVDDFATADGPWIGARTDGAGHTDGRMDDVRVYDRALTHGEVRKLYRSTAPYYKSEVDGTSLRNVSVKGSGSDTSSPFLDNLQFFADYETWSAGNDLPNRWTRNNGVFLLDNEGEVGESSRAIIGSKSGFYDQSQSNQRHFFQDQSKFEPSSGEDFYAVSWLRPVSLSDTKDNDALSTWDGSGWILGTTGSNEARFVWYDGGGNTNFLAGPPLGDSTEYMLEVWWTRSDQTLHLRLNDGSTVTKTTSNSGFIGGSSGFSVGKRASGSSPWNGVIDHFAIVTGDISYWVNNSSWLYNSGNGRTWNEIKQYTK